MARRQRHLVDVGDVPRRDDVPAGVGVRADRLDDLRDLVDLAAVGSRPRAPLVAVDRAEVAELVGPLVPDRDAALLEPAHVGVSAQEPEQLADDRAQVQPLGRDDGEALGEVEAHLVAEHAAGAGTRAVGLVDALRHDVVEQVEVLAHAREPTRRHPRPPGHLPRMPPQPGVPPHHYPWPHDELPLRPCPHRDGDPDVAGRRGRRQGHRLARRPPPRDPPRRHRRQRHHR